VQRGDLSRGVTIPGAAVTGGRGGTTGGGRGGRGPGGSGGPSSAPALGKGKGVSARVVHDDDEVSSDEDEPLQARLRSRFPAGGSSSLGTASLVAVAVEAASVEAATDRRAAEEAAAKEAAVEGSSVPGQVPSFAASAKRAATPSGSSPPAKRPYRGIWRPRYAPKSLRPVLFSFCEAHYFSFPSSRLPPATRAPSVATVASSAAPAAGATAPAIAAEAVPELVAGGTPQTPEGVPEDVSDSPADARRKRCRARRQWRYWRRRRRPSCAPQSPLRLLLQQRRLPQRLAPPHLRTQLPMRWGNRRWSWGIPPAMLQATFP
jgi:hypothetical protein